jgi:hypothetical protein
MLIQFQVHFQAYYHIFHNGDGKLSHQLISIGNIY